MNAIITGAAKGIGKEIALSLAKNGINVAINSRSEIDETFIDEIRSIGVKCVSYKCDVSDFAECEKLVKFAHEELGSIDILINNAGITKDNLILRMSEKDFDDVINVNLKGAFNMIKHVSKIMLKQKSGCIINISSVVGLIGNAGQANYSASKAGLLGLTKTIAKEFGSKGIRCNAVAPGFIQTEMTDKLTSDVKEKMTEAIPLKRFGNTSDVSQTVMFLISSGYITGQVINVDGGMVM